MADDQKQKIAQEAARVIQQQRDYIIKLAVEKDMREAKKHGLLYKPMMADGYRCRAAALPLNGEAISVMKALRQELSEALRIQVFSEAAQFIKRQQAHIAEMEDQLGLGDQSSPQGRRAQVEKLEAVERPSNDV